jgi:hypothetical protein
MEEERKKKEVAAVRKEEEAHRSLEGVRASFRSLLR